MSFLLAHPSAHKAIDQFLYANDISHLHKIAHSLQHPEYRGYRDTWECVFFSEVRQNPGGIPASVYCEALKEWLKGYKAGNGPELKGIISQFGGKFFVTFCLSGNQ